MQNKVTYEFAIIRVVPKVEREEFINVGVLLYAKRKRYLGIKYQLNQQRLLAFAPTLNLNLLKAYLEAWEQTCMGHPKGGSIGQFEQSFRFRWLTAPKSTMLQCSPTHPGLCEQPAAKLEELFGFYVL